MRTSIRGCVTYTVKQFKDPTHLSVYIDFLKESGKELEKQYPVFKNWWRTRLDIYCKKGRVMICFRDKEPVGIMLSKLGRSTFDPQITILQQTLLYAKPNTRAAYHLMLDFLDFGKNHADHIITMIGENTNIKRQSLEKLGFKKIEELYRIEV